MTNIQRGMQEFNWFEYLNTNLTLEGLAQADAGGTSAGKKLISP